MLVANFMQKCQDISPSKYDISTLPALELKQKLCKEHSLRNVPVWTTVTRLTDSVTLPNFLNLNEGYKLDDYGFKMHFFILHCIQKGYGIQGNAAFPGPNEPHQAGVSLRRQPQRGPKEHQITSDPSQD